MKDMVVMAMVMAMAMDTMEAIMVGIEEEDVVEEEVGEEAEVEGEDEDIMVVDTVVLGDPDQRKMTRNQRMRKSNQGRKDQEDALDVPHLLLNVVDVVHPLEAKNLVVKREHLVKKNQGKRMMKTSRPAEDVNVHEDSVAAQDKSKSNLSLLFLRTRMVCYLP